MLKINKKKEIIKYLKLFVIDSFSPIRSGNISIKYKLKGKEGFLISPSGKKKYRINDKGFSVCINASRYREK